jgi:hypothetical protein
MFRTLMRSLCATALLASGSGCALLSGATGNLAGGLANALQKQSDVELVREGSPAFLLLLDGLLESSPDNPALLLAAANAQIAYATAFVGEEEMARAAAMYGKARDYGLRALARNARFRRVMDRPLAEFETAVPHFRKRDVPALYATANAWTGWIVNNPGSMRAMSELPKAMALMRRVMQLDPGYPRGGADMFMGIYYAVQPLGAGRDLAKSRVHFEKAFEYAGPDGLLPRVTFAEFYARYAFDRELFEQTLKTVVEHETTDPELRLVNEIARRRARALLERADDLF